jgi:hypothetical protein
MSFQVTEVQKALKGADYPLDGAQLAELADKNGAGHDLVAALRGVGQADGPNEVMKQLKGELGGRTSGKHTSEQRSNEGAGSPGFPVTEVQMYLKGADYPMDGAQLAELAGKNGADDDLIGALRGVGEVDGPNGVMKQLRSHLGGRPAIGDR